MTIHNVCRTKFFIRSMVLFILLFTFCFHLAAQMFEALDDFEWEDESPVKGDQKSAATAILLSSIFPGTGHIYANPKSLGSYLFPIIEVGLWVGYFYYYGKGTDIENDYMKYADNNYSRAYQHEVEDYLIKNDQSSKVYNEEHFRLDNTNTQHFYEDIGKYNKYIFGWQDWYEIYVSPSKEINWHFNDEGIWLGNRPIDADKEDPYQEPYSELRAKYIKMRRDAQEHYDISYLMSFGLAANRIASSISAALVTQKYNRDLRYSFNFGITPTYAHGAPTPTINFGINY